MIKVATGRNGAFYLSGKKMKDNPPGGHLENKGLTGTNIVFCRALIVKI